MMPRVNIKIEVSLKEDGEKIIKLFDYTDHTIDGVSGNTAIWDGEDVILNACFPDNWSSPKIEATISRIMKYYDCRWDTISVD